MKSAQFISIQAKLPIGSWLCINDNLLEVSHCDPDSGSGALEEVGLQVQEGYARRGYTVHVYLSQLTAGNQKGVHMRMGY